MTKVDETIDKICDWIQKQLEQTNCANESMILPEMTKSLAELISAKDSVATYRIDG